MKIRTLNARIFAFFSQKIFVILFFCKMKFLNFLNLEASAFGKDAVLQMNKGNKAAGARARKAALELMKDLKEFRKVSVAEAKK